MSKPSHSHQPTMDELDRKRALENGDAGLLMSAFEQNKRARNLKDGFKETKGLKDGHCNRRGCQKPLQEESEIIGERYSMSDHETLTNERLYYCATCAMVFTQADMQSKWPARIRIDKIEEAV